MTQDTAKGECFLPPQVVKCGYRYASKHTGHRRGRDRQVCSGSRRLQITLECGHQKLELAQVLVVDQSRMAFALDTACKSGPVHGQIVNSGNQSSPCKTAVVKRTNRCCKFCYKDAGKVHEVSFRSGVDQTCSLFLVRQASLDVRMPSQFPDSTPSKPETVVAKPTNCLP